MHLTQINCSYLKNENYKAQVADIVILMIPGLMSTCLEIINSGETENHKVIVVILLFLFLVVEVNYSLFLLVIIYYMAFNFLYSLLCIYGAMF